MILPAIQWFPEEREAGRPPERISITEWAEKYRVLGHGAAVRGPYQVAMVPFFAPIMDCCQSTDIDEVVLCKPGQIGGTELFLNVIGYYVDQDPSQVMITLADENTAKYISTRRVAPMFRDSSHLRRHYNPNEFGRTEINFANGAYLAMAWASSPAMLASRPIRIMACDEIDKDGYYAVTREADALSLARERTNTYPSGYFKHMLYSTPTTEEGNITRELMSCDIIYDWHVPCPRCGQLQPLRWSIEYAYGFEAGQYLAHDGTMRQIGCVVWEGGRKATARQIQETARYQCGECGSAWTTIEKNAAVSLGRMVPRTIETGYERKIGYHVNRIYSLFDGGRLEKLVAQWVKIFEHDGDRRKGALQGFINSTLAEPWKQVVVSSNTITILKARCELAPQTVPETAVALTAGVDCQKRGFWFTVRAWSRLYTSWLIHYGFLGDWGEVEDLIFKTAYPVVGSDRTMRIWRAAVDTGGGKADEGDLTMTEEAYFWIRKNGFGRGVRVWATKGSSKPLAGKIHLGKMLDQTPSGKPIHGGLQIVLIDTDKVKDMVYYRLAQAMELGEQAAYLHAETDERYVKQILAEEKQLNKRGIAEWVQVHRDNHFLDCEGLAHVVAEPEWPGGGVHLLPSFKAQPPDHGARPVEHGDGESKRARPALREFERPKWLNR